MSYPGTPPQQGLYDPRNEHDNCGMGFIVNLNGERSHEIIKKGIEILINLTHRGACGCDPETGDGAGILIQIPHEFFERECSALGFSLPPAGLYGVGMMFLPVEPKQRLKPLRRRSLGARYAQHTTRTWRQGCAIPCGITRMRCVLPANVWIECQRWASARRSGCRH